MSNNTLNKSERLKSKKAIEALFRSGLSISSPPFRLLIRESENQPHPLLMTVAVPKRLIKRAVDRNLIKRRTREAYRLKKSELFSQLTEKGVSYEIMFLYQSSGIQDYRSIRQAVNFLLQKLSQKAEFRD